MMLRGACKNSDTNIFRRQRDFAARMQKTTRNLSSPMDVQSHAGSINTSLATARDRDGFRNYVALTFDLLTSRSTHAKVP